MTKIVNTFVWIILWLALSLHVAAQTQEDGLSWEPWRDVIVRSMAGGDSAESIAQVQLVAEILRASWNTGSAAAQIEFCKLADGISGDGAVYHPTGASFYDHYMMFVDSLSLPPASAKSANLLRLRGIYDAVSRAHDQDFVQTIKSTQGQEYRCPRYSTIPVAALEENSVVWTFQYKNSDNSTKPKGATILARPFLAYRRGTSGQWVSAITREEGFDISVKFRNLVLETIQPGHWYSEVLVEQFKKGPFVPASSLSHTSEQLWGAGGVVGWHPQQTLVAFGPRFEVRLSDAQYSRLKSMLSEGASVSVGPFEFMTAQARSDTKQTVEFDASRHVIIFTDSAATGVVIGVVNGPNPD